MDGLRTPRLRLRRWRDEDAEVFHRLNADADIMRFFAHRMTREEADAARTRWNEELEHDAMSFLAAERSSDGRIIGTIGLAPVDEPIHGFAPAVQVGWRLLPDVRGEGLATEGARACLAYGFETLGLSEIVAQCVTGNTASAAVMHRLGMRWRCAFDHPKVCAQTHPHLVRHDLYAITRDAWRGRNAADSEPPPGP